MTNTDKQTKTISLDELEDIKNILDAKCKDSHTNSQLTLNSAIIGKESITSLIGIQMNSNDKATEAKSKKGIR